jgi:hypothetical protein
MSIFGSFNFWHPFHKPSAAGQAPAVQFKVNATTQDCPNGVIDFSPYGGARLIAVEDCRAQCAASNDVELVKFGASLKAYYAFVPSLSDPSLNDAQRFNIKSNCTFALGIASYAGRMVPVFTDDKPDPSGKELWSTGSQVTDHGSFETTVTLADIAGILQDAMKRSALRL